MSSTIIRFTVLAALLPLAAGCDRDTPRTATPVAVATVESGATPPAEQPSQPAPVSYADAEAAYHQGRYPEATELFAGYVGTNPDNAWGHYMYGLSAWKPGDPELALEGFDAALRLDPTHRKSLLNSGRVLLETDRPREALVRIEKALSIEPLSGEALRLLGRARHELGQVPQAIEAYQRALALDERDVWAMNNLGLIHIQQGSGPEALPPLARAVELRPSAPVFRNNLGMALELSGHTTEARRAYAAAVASDSTYTRAGTNLTRLGGPVEVQATDSAEVDLVAIAREFEAQIEGWRNTASSDSVTVDSAAMVRDTVSQ
jgi:predicted Zn-dependent protease